MRITWKHTSLGLALGLGLLAANVRDAEACGGCFAPPETPSNVNSHRMAVKIAGDTTILWDQIRYSGDPADFVWVLPMPAVGAIDLAAEEFFDNLDVATAPQIFNPNVCGAGGPGRFAANDAAGSEKGAGGGEDVTVYYQGVVGPYETVTIGSEDPQALLTWLTDHGYSVPSATLPTIAHYVEMNNVFIALRLAPDFGVEQMQPVRVTIPGQSLTFPLQMVKVGADTKLGLTLWVFADTRYHSLNYPDTVVREEDIVWDSNLGRSNYTELFDKAVLDAGGKGWVTESAGPAGYVYLGGSVDASLATEGLTSPYLTRMRTDMRTYLMDADLFLEPAWDTSDVFNQHYPSVDIAYIDGDCSGSGGGGSGGGGGGSGPGGGWFVGGGCSVAGMGAGGGGSPWVLGALAGVTALGALARRRRTR